MATKGKYSIENRIEISTANLLVGLGRGETYSIEGIDGYHMLSQAGELGYINVDGKAQTVKVVEEWMGWYSLLDGCWKFSGYRES